MSDEKKLTGRYPTLPTANLDVEGIVPLTTLEKIADEHAYELWGEDIARGKPFPVADWAGDVFAYVFPYIIGSHQFPEYEQIFDRVRSLRSKSLELSEADDRIRAEFDTESRWLVSQFGSVYVSATRANFPILRALHSLHPYFLVGELAQEEAERHFDRKDVKLEKIYFLGPLEEYFGFTSQEDRVLIHVNSLEKETPEKISRIEALGAIDKEMLTEIEGTWEHVIDSAPIGIDAADVSKTHTMKQIPHWELIPVINGTWWCVPTAFTMAVGFWDNYVKGKGTITGYGRLIGFWFEHPKYPKNMSLPRNNVPSFIDELIDPKTGTWRKGFKNFEDFISKMYGYKFSSIPVTPANDWAWNDLKKEVDSGRPCVWSVTTPNHAMTAFGYRITAKGKFAIVYNTWGTTAQQQRDEWNYTLCKGMTRILPGGGTGLEHLIIISPDGGETVHTYILYKITWYVWGKKIRKTNLSTSYDGGMHWIPIASDLDTKPGWNSYYWLPMKTTTRGRIRIQGYTEKKEYIAGDGSQTNFSVKTGPKNNKVAFQAHNNQYVCAEGGGGREVVANRNKIASWETFELIDLGNKKVALRANNGQYVCAEGGGGREVVANRDKIASWETFKLTQL